MKKLDKLANKFSDVAKTSNERANQEKVVWIKDEDIIDNPKNEEDCTYLDDILSSIESQGFTHPLMVTDFEMKPGKYMLISGHRSRTAGRAKNYKEFPCIVKHYATEADVYEALLSANVTRNTDRDPLLYTVRYRQYEELLNMRGFSGSKREEIAKRLGLSVKHADKYNTFNRIIKEVWELVRAGMPMEPLCTLAKESKEVQLDIYRLLKAAEEREHLNSAAVKNIIDVYRGKANDSNADSTLKRVENAIKSPRDEEDNMAKEKSVLTSMSGSVKRDIVGTNSTEYAINRENVEKNARMAQLIHEKPEKLSDIKIESANNNVKDVVDKSGNDIEKKTESTEDDYEDMGSIDAEIKANFRVKTDLNVYEVIYGEFDMSYFCWIRDVRGVCRAFNLLAVHNFAQNIEVLSKGGIEREDAKAIIRCMMKNFG